MQKKKKTNHAEKWVRIWEHVSGYRKPLSLMILILVAIEGVHATTPYLIGRTISVVGEGPFTSILWLGAGILSLLYLSKVLGMLMEAVDIKKFLFEIVREKKIQTINHYYTLSLGQLREKNSGETQSQAMKGESSFPPFIETMLFRLAPSVLKVIIISVAALVIFREVGVIIVLYTFINLYAQIKLILYFYPLLRKMEKVENRVGKAQTEILRHPGIIKTNNASEQMVDNYNGKLRHINRFRKIFWMRYVFLRMFVDLSLVAHVSIFMYVCWLASQGVYDKGDVVTLLLWLNIHRGAIDNIPSTFKGLMSYYAKIDKYFELLDEKPEVVSGNVNINGTPVEEISLKDVCFEYSEKKKKGNEEEDESDPEKFSLKNVSLSIKKGDSVAFVGPSGGGKSSIFNLIMRGFDPTSGMVTVNGRDLRSLTLDSYWRKFGYVEQSIELFDQSIRANLTYAADNSYEYSDERLDTLLDTVGLPDLKWRLGKRVGELGRELSGGEKLRVGIARALIRDPEILLLDEATAALDAESEAAIHETLAVASRNRTVIMIAHRLSTVKDADVIHYVAGGEILASGNHEELKRYFEPYRRLVELQAV